MTEKSSLPGEGMRKITKEIMDISKNAVFVGGVKYLSDKSGSSMLFWFYVFVSAIFIAHVNSYIQGTLFSSTIQKKLGIGSKMSKVLGWPAAFIVLFFIIFTTDQTISFVASAQVK